MKSAHCLVAYHGCDAVVRDDLVTQRLKKLDHSQNQYDWLGPGAYFFEGDLKRALLFAEASAAYPEKMFTQRPIATPAAVGVVLCVSSWLDMTTQEGLGEFSLALEGMTVAFQNEGKNLPVNRPAADDDADIIYRALDSAVFSFMHEIREHRKLAPFDAVRGAFPQGSPIAENSGFRQHTHVQIAVRNDDCIVGWFLPEGAELLTAKQYNEAQGRLAAIAGAGRKRRVRA